MRSILLGCLSLLCVNYWVWSATILTAALIVVLGTALAVAGVGLSRRAFGQTRWKAEQRLWVFGEVLCYVGILANIGLFSVALIDL